VVPWLPEKLPSPLVPAWSAPLNHRALAGIAVAGGVVVVADRDLFDKEDVFHCYDAATGLPKWAVRYAANGKLDYGPSARATPLIDGERVFTLSAFGDLHCLRRNDGKVLWKKNLLDEYGGELTAWGMCSSPLVVDGKLIVNPGGPQASLVALRPETGEELWRCPGARHAFASFIVGEFGGRRQLVGYDAISLGGWDPATGRRLWRITPDIEGDFNVPTPIAYRGQALVATENNGARLYGFDREGGAGPQPLATHADLAPDTSTPVILDDRVFGVWGGTLFCLNAADGLEPLWTGRDRALHDYASLIASPAHGGRVIIATLKGELLLLDAAAHEMQMVSRARAFEGGESMSHPAVAGKRIYLRSPNAVTCFGAD